LSATTTAGWSHRADVIRIEPPGGDSYRAYSLSFLAANQRKRGIVIDHKSPDGITALHALLAESEIYAENLRPNALANLGLDEDGPATRLPGLVHCSISAFGRAAAFAELPGFDPVFQVRSGMAMAQGSLDHPIVGGAPFNDVATGALGALGSMAALYQRLSSGRGQRLWVSPAASSSFVQSGELTTWPGSPALGQHTDEVFAALAAGEVSAR
jgi:crotonobetainyl-CoA:carnitine CoA-transferase CaiB-like acyl-CoA transferase